MAPCINEGARQAVKAFLKQVRQTGVGKQGITQRLENGAEIYAYPNPVKEELLNVFHRVTNSNGATMTDTFVAGTAKGKPKHVRSGISSPEGGSLFFCQVKKDF